MKIIEDYIDDPHLKEIAAKIAAGGRITAEEGLMLYTRAGLSLLAMLSGIVRRRQNRNFVFFNRNFHIEPTNKCIYNCRFCSYHKPAGDPESWEYTHDEMLGMVRQFDDKEVTEVHIVGGVHPLYNIHYYGELVQKIKQYRPGLHIKAFSAIELDYMITKSGMTISEGLAELKKYGLDSIPGGGAEIFNKEIRKEICPEKASAERWLEIHETAHNLGIPSNATMLYGHIENYAHRIDHMTRLRELQDKTGGFNAFIPLKYKKANNSTKQDFSTYIELGYTKGAASIFLGFTPWESYYNNYGATAFDSTAAKKTFSVVNIGASFTKALKITETYSLPLKATLVINPSATYTRKDFVHLVFGITF